MKRTLTTITLLLVALTMTTCDQEGPELPTSTAQAPATLRESRVDITLNGKEDHNITWEKARSMMRDYRDQHLDEPYAWYFGDEFIHSVLAQDGAVGLRIYSGLNAEGEFRPVIVGVTASNQDINELRFAKSLGDTVRSASLVGDESLPCPPYCPEFD